MKWERAQQHGIDEAEDGRVRPDSERQGYDGHDRETGSLGQHANSVPQVLPQTVHVPSY
jgi:hypothetical protein